MPALPSIAVAIPTRNQSEYLVDALDSVFAQTIQPVDVLVCDDAGDDNCEEVVEAYRVRLPADAAAKLRYIRNGRCLGLGGNFDRAVREAKGEFVIKLDSDDMLEPLFSQTLGAELVQCGQAGWAHVNALNILKDKTPIRLAHTLKRPGFYNGAEALKGYLRHNDTCHCVMIRKTAYLEVGGYRPEMTAGEDWLLWLEMLIRGWGYVFLNEPLARMRKYDDRWELMTGRRRRFVESMKYMDGYLDRLLGEVGVPEGCTPVGVKNGFAGTAASLCRSSAMDEGDSATRKLLFDAAVHYVPSAGNRLAALVFAPLPRRLTVALAKISEIPRDLVRWGIGILKQRRRP